MIFEEEEEEGEEGGVVWVPNVPWFGEASRNNRDRHHDTT